MKFETLTAQTTEYYLEADKVSVSVNPWSNMEGANIMLLGNGEGMPLRMACALRWEEIDMLIATLAVARAGG